MKIWEIIQEDLTGGAGEGAVGVGNAGSETFMMHPDKPHRKMKQIPQVGYGIQIGGMKEIPTTGDKVIPASRYNADNDLGQLNQVIGG